MKRRDFFKKSAVAGVATGAAISAIDANKLYAATDKLLDVPYDLVSVKGGEPWAMFDKAIASMGGMQKFVSKGDVVLVKPNVGWNVRPELAANTNPYLVKQVIQHCFNVGAARVVVFDHTCDDWRACYENSEIKKFAAEAGADVVPGNDEDDYYDVGIPGAKSLKSAAVHKWYRDADKIINVPVLKSHGSARLTIAMKNLMGVVWDRGYWHRNDLQQCIADFPLYRKPDLNVVDAYRAMMKNGPRGKGESDVVTMKYQVVSPDIVAADAAATKIFGLEIDDVPHIRKGAELGYGADDLSKLSINRIEM
jgi:uncharacterized protein (DUF362 family)